MLKKLSAQWARIELWASGFLALCVTLLILLNVVTRNIGHALFWVDELAIYAMIWMTFLGASAAFHYRTAVSITLLTDAVPARLRFAIRKAVDLMILAFALALIWFCWRWFLPLEIAQSGFDKMAFQGKTFNFIYAEPTLTLGYPKYLFWLIMWIFAFGTLLHSITHVLTWSTQEDPA